MQVVDSRGFGSAICAHGAERRQVDMRLVGEQAPGAWVLVFIDAAREVLDEERALRIRDALEGLAAVASGEPFEHLFADLIGREPELPDFLRPEADES